jgi:DNA-binding NtrC family response regulator
MFTPMDRHHVDSPHTAGARKKRASIVVLDPSPISLLALAGALDSQGYGCVCARDGGAAVQALMMGTQDALVCDVGDDAAAALATLESMRATEGYEQLPALLIAEGRWAGLEKKTEAMRQATRCLFKPIDPNSFIAVVDQILWMPSLVAAHRRRGSSPSRPGWVTL